MPRNLLLTLFLLVPAMAQQTPPAQKKQPAQAPYKITDQEKEQIRAKFNDLDSRVKELRSKGVDPGSLADVEVYQKAVAWALRYPEEFYQKSYVARALDAADTGIARAKALAAGNAPWAKQTGRLIRGYRSKVDGIYQPYGLVIPDSYDGSKPVRLDLMMHGRGATLSEVSFISAHDGPNDIEEGAFERRTPAAARVPAGQDFIQLDVFGRVNNGYRWSAETDVFEALASVQQRYKIDPNKIVLRGFSMGGHGAWHIGLHYPDKWAVVEAGAGFTDTKVYGRIANLTPWQEDAIHIYDSQDYALNAFDVPILGYAGELDNQLKGMVNIREQLERDGYQFKQEPLRWSSSNLPTLLFIIGPQIGHSFHPDSRKISNQYIQDTLNKARDTDHIRFVTWTTRYNKCFWVTVDGLEKSYQRAEVDAERDDSRKQLTIKTHNVSRLLLTDSSRAQSVTLDGQKFSGVKGEFEKKSGKWAVGAPPKLSKTHGLQGPIDDAFMESFLCVRPTGTPIHPEANKAALDRFDMFSKDFAKWLRADVRVKEDTTVSKEDIASNNLVLFGDPGSNKILAQIAGKLPIKWTKDEIIVGTTKFSAADHIPVLIYPNPLNPKHYVVINTGITLHAPDLEGTNALQYPRLGDYAVFTITGGKADGKAEIAGMFDENWQIH